MGYIPPPPPPNPAMDFGCYADGRDCYDVEQEALMLARQLDGRPLIYQAAWWRLQWLKFKYFPLDVSEIQAKYNEYYSSQYESQKVESVTT